MRVLCMLILKFDYRIMLTNFIILYFFPLWNFSILCLYLSFHMLKHHSKYYFFVHVDMSSAVNF